MLAFFDKLDAWFEANDFVFFAVILGFAAILFAADAVQRACKRGERKL